MLLTHTVYHLGSALGMLKKECLGSLELSWRLVPE